MSPFKFKRYESEANHDIDPDVTEDLSKTDQNWSETIIPQSSNIPNESNFLDKMVQYK